MSGRVLVVDDDPVLLDAVATLLADAGHDVVPACDPWDALVAATEPGAIHLLLTDVAMPHLTGPELAERFAELRPGVPVLFMSAWSRHDMDPPLPESAPLVAKPFTRAGLLEAVRGMLPEGAA